MRWMPIVAALCLLAVLVACGCQGAAKEAAPAPITSATRPAASIGSAAGSSEALRLDIADVAGAIRQAVASLLSAVQDWTPADAKGQQVTGVVHQAAGSLTRAADSLSAKDQQIRTLQADLAGAQKGIADCDASWRKVYDEEYAQRVQAQEALRDAQNSATREAQHALGWMSVAGVVLLAVGLALASALPAMNLLGKGLCGAAVVLSLASVCLLAFFRLTDAMLPILWWTMASVAALGVAALAYYLWSHRNSLSEVVRSIDAARASTPEISGTFKKIAAQIQSAATAELVNKYRTPAELPAGPAEGKA